MTDNKERDGGEFGETQADRDLPSAIEHLSKVARERLGNHDDDYPDASGVEVPQDGDPGR